MKALFFFWSYLRFYFRSGNAHSIHSPFVFDLYTKVLAVDKNYYCFKKIEQLRSDLLHSSISINVLDLGAGAGSGSRRTIASVAKNSEKSTQLAQLLFRLTEHFKPKTIVELGTSFGLTTLYLSKANPKATVYTFEGCPETNNIASGNFRDFNATNIVQIQGNINETLYNSLKAIPLVDMVFFDANHQYAPTLAYFQLCLAKITEESIFVFDDIYWSPEMTKAWEEIKAHPMVTLSIDLFYMGLVFFRKAQPKQHFSLRI